jgi:uncharacterized protein (DUF2336 family)
MTDNKLLNIIDGSGGDRTMAVVRRQDVSGYLGQNAVSQKL